MSDLTLEEQVLLNRYCYYVLANPLIPDSVYDQIERAAREFYPADNVVHKVGSCLPSSYPDRIKKLAKAMGRE
jgi:NAD-dependent DNA ligase